MQREWSQGNWSKARKQVKQCNNEAKQKRKHIKDSTESRENRGRNTQEGKD